MIKGKWYYISDVDYRHWIIKFDCIKASDSDHRKIVHSSEVILDGEYDEYGSCFGAEYEHVWVNVPISKIYKMLPDGHKDIREFKLKRIMR